METDHIIGRNEEGSVVLIAMLILVLLTALGLASIHTSTMELKIFRNQRIYNENFYRAEAAVLEASQRIELENDADNVRPGAKTWLVDTDTDLEEFTALPNDYKTSGIHSDSSYAAHARGIVSGASLDMATETNVYGFTVYGYSEKNNGNVLIKTGLKKRF